MERTMKELIVVATLAVIASPAASMTLRSNDGGKVGVWIDYEAMKGADRLIHAGVNRWDPVRLLPFVACIVDSGTEITVTGLHAFSGYADVVVTSGSCTGVVHLDAINTGANAQGKKIEKNIPEKNTEMIPEIVVRPPYDPYRVAVIPGEFHEANVREWIVYCHPHLSPADGFGIRHYVYQEGTTGCEFGLSAR